MEKGTRNTCKGHRRATNPPHPGAWSGVMPGVPNRSTKARIYQQKSQDISAEIQDISAEKPGFVSRKGRIYQQKIQDAAAAAKLLHTRRKRNNSRRKKNNSRGGCRSVGPSPPPSRDILEEFWDYFRAKGSSWGSTLLPPSLENTNPSRKEP